MKKKILTIVLTLAGISFILFSILAFAGGLKKKSAGILIETEPSSQVFINGEDFGKTPIDINLEPGEIILKIVSDSNLGSYETKINLESGVKTIVKRVFNENSDLVSGAVVSFEKLAKDESLLAVVSIPDSGQVFLDSKAYGFSPIRVSVPAGDHDLVVSSLGYLGKSLPIRVYKGYKLTAVVKLAKDLGADRKIETKEKIEILKVDKENLAVRSKSNEKSEILGYVKPGDIYEVLDKSEDKKWYKIEFETIVYGDKGGIPTTLEGWVDSAFIIVRENLGFIRG